MNTKKILAAFLSAAMVLTSMAVPVFADDAVASAGSAGGGTGGTTVTNPTNPTNPGTSETSENQETLGQQGGNENAKNVAQIGDKKYSSLEAAVAAVSDSATIKLLMNTTESITIPAGKNITLDLNGKNITSDGKSAIINKGTLTVKGAGNVSASGDSHAAVANFPDATMVLNGGTYSSDKWYVIKNLGAMTIDGDVTIKMDNKDNTASLIDNGWYGNSDKVAGESVPAAAGKASLTIKSGNFLGKSGEKSCSVVKNDDYGTLTIEGGTFDSTNNNGTSNAATILNWNTATISGGTFKGRYPLSNGAYNNEADKGQLTVTGGEFIGGDTIFGICKGGDGKGAVTISGGTFTAPKFAPDGSDGSDNITNTGGYTIAINGGTFSTDVSAYLADKNLKVKQNSFGKYVIKNKETVQMGEEKYPTIKEALDKVQENAATTIKLLMNTTESITIPAGKNITLDLNGYTLTNEENESRDKDGKLIKVGKHTIENYGTLTITDSSTAKTGKVDNVSHGKAALFNADIATAVLNGGKFMRSQETGIDQDNSGGNSWYTIANQGTLTINSGVTVENKGYFSSNIVTGNYNNKSTAVSSKLTINGGTFKGGVKTVKVDECGVLTINDGTFINEKYACIMNWNKTEIKGGTFTSLASESVWNGRYTDTTAVGELKIAGGTFNGTVENSAKYSGGTISISGGTFSEDVSKYCVNKHFASKNSDGKYEVKNIEDMDAPVTSLYKKDKKTTSYATGTNYTLINDYSDNDKIVLFYTLDGSNPTTSTKRKVYNGEKLKINNAVTVKTVYMKACGECENCIAGKYSECTAPVYGQIGTYKYTVKKKNSNAGSSTGTSTRGVTYSGRTYTSDIFGVEHKSHDAYINGYADGTVKPDGKITREEIAAILYRVSNDASAVVASGDKFNDVSADRWSASAIEFMARIGVINGYTDGSFKPSNNLTRAEFTALVSRFANLSNNGTNKIYNDIDASNWAYKYVMELSNAGYMNGYEDGSFRPESEITRAEVVTVINKIIGRNPSAEYVKTLSSGFSDLSSDAWYYTNVMEATTTHEYYLTNGIETKWENIK